MSTRATNEELLAMLARDQYRVDAQAVAEAMLRRRGPDPFQLIGLPPSQVLEPAEIEASAVPASKH